VAFSLPAPSRRLILLIVAPVLGLIVIIGAAANRNEERRAGPTGSPAPTGEVVDYNGVGGIRFGTTSASLSRDYGMLTRPGDCGPRLPTMPQVSPVLVDDKLALVWVSAPVHTPEGITVGSEVSAVRKAYPQGVEMPPPTANQYPGILVTQGDRAYLFLYSDNQVRKVIVGFEQYAKQLYASGGDTC
jgi:hypothetical protein